MAACASDAACAAEVEEKKVDEDTKKIVTIKWGRTLMWGRLCYTTGYGLDDLFKKVNALPWVSKTLPATPTNSSGWGKNDKDYHLEASKDYYIELHIGDKLIHEFKWNDQKEAGTKTLSKERWEDGFLAAVYSEFPNLKDVVE